MFLNENTVLERFIRMEEGAVKYITRVKAKQLDDISRKFHVKMESAIDPDRCGRSLGLIAIAIVGHSDPSRLLW